MNGILRVLVYTLLFGFTLLAIGIGALVTGLRYYPAPLLDLVNRSLASQQLNIHSFEMSSLGFSQAHITRLSILSPEGPLTLEQIDLKYSLPKLQLQQLNIGQAQFKLNSAPLNQTLVPAEAGNVDEAFFLSPYLERWKRIKPLSASLKQGRFQWQDRSILMEVVLEHQLENDQLSVTLEHDDLLVNLRLNHKWQRQLQYSSLISLGLSIDPASGSDASAVSLLKVKKTELKQSPNGWSVGLDAELALAQSWNKISPWVKAQEVEAVSGRLKLEISGQLADNIIGFDDHQLKLHLNSPEGMAADLRIAPLAQALDTELIHLGAKLPKSLVLEWQQGLKLSSGELHLQLNAGDKRLNVELMAKQCDMHNCISAYQLIAGQGSWFKPGIEIDWHNLKASGELRWQQSEISVEGQLALKLNKLVAQDITLSDVNIQASRFELDLQWPKNSAKIQLRIPSVAVKETQVQWPQGAAIVAAELKDTVLSYGVELHASTELELSLTNPVFDGLKLPGAGFKGNGSLFNSALEVDGLLSSDTAAELLALKIQYQLARQQGLFHLASKLFPFTGDKQRLSQRFSRWPFSFDLVGGELELSSQGKFQMAEALDYEHKTNISLKGIGGVYDDLLMVGLDFEDELQFQKQNWFSSGSGKLRLAMLDVGLVVENIQAQISVSGSQATLSVAGFEAEVLDGKWLFEDFAYTLGAEQKQSMVLRLKHIQLAELIRQAQYDGLEAEASISGRLPISVEAGVMTVSDGVLSADKPGYLRYTGLSGGDNQLIGVVSQALSNYHFKSLTSTVDYGVTGELDLGVRMIGENPDMQQKVNVNLNVNDDIPSLLKSLRAGRVVSDLIEAKLN